MEVCLIWPGTSEPAPPFGAMSMASVLEAEGFSSKVADFSFEEISAANVRRKIDGEPDVIGVTVYSSL